MNATVAIRCIDCKKELHILVAYPHDHEGAHLNAQVTLRLRLAGWSPGRRVRCPSCQEHRANHRTHEHPHPSPVSP